MLPSNSGRWYLVEHEQGGLQQGVEGIAIELWGKQGGESVPDGR